MISFYPSCIYIYICIYKTLFTINPRQIVLGMHVIAHDPYAPADHARAIGVELVSFDQAITTADFISLHMPLTPTTSKNLNDDTFAKMKKGVQIVNVARGRVIDEDALVRALDAGIVAQVLTFSYLIHIYLTVEESQ